MSRSQVIDAAADYFDRGQFAEELARRVALRTESQVPGTQETLRAYLTDEIQPYFEALGFG